GAWSTALLGVGYLIGLGGGIAMLVGVAIAWLIAVPLIGAQTGILASEGHLLEFASTIWMSRVRFIGAGTIAVASLWTLAQLAPGVIDGLKTLWKSRNAQDTAPCERDLPAWFIISTVIAVAITLFLSFYSFLPSHNAQTALFTIASVALCLILSFLIAASCGYMAGLIGASSSPISGVMIIAIIAICLVFRGLHGIGSRASQLFPHEEGLDVAFALFVLTALTASAAISNDNLQDLKTGQLVSATPWKQQIALIIGCVVGAAITAPILNLLHEAYGFAGEVSAHGGNLVLTAPQATLMLSLARGILGGDMDWAMFTIGAVTGVSFIFFERFLQTKGLTLPALAVGMGIYLPSDVSVTIALGGAVAHVTQKWSRRPVSDRTDQPGTLVACGFIVGESLMGIAIAGMHVVRPDIFDRFTPPSPELRQISSAFIFAAITFWIGRVSARGWTKI
ncbi:uncharacterized protein LOC100906773, partial [Galendromus occidentalis]|uniref:Uncharacterized protein LOC100906773 n=1 Tax=Galendromus occidentalis TaxID=34638 RepID=A0AAJ6VVD0_9ACAR